MNSRLSVWSKRSCSKINFSLSQISCAWLGLILLLAAREGQATSKNSIISRASNILFGDIWTYDEYCAETRNDSLLLKEDDEFKRLYNQSVYSSVASIASTPGIWTNLSFWAVKAKPVTMLICSVGSWDYASQSLYNQSISPAIDPMSCESQINRWINSKPPNTTAEVDSKLASRDWIQLQSFGKVPPGEWFADYLWPGDYDDCVHKASGLYCLANLRAKSWPESSPGQHVGFKSGICLPKTCDQTTVRREENMRKLNSLIWSNSRTNDSQYQLTDVFCLPASDSEVRSWFTGDDYLKIVLLVLPIFWSILLIYGTLFDLVSNEKPSYLANAFNLRIGWAKLMDDRHVTAQLAGLNAIKVMAMIYLLTAHAFILYTSYQANMLEFRAKVQNSFLAAVVMQGQHGVPGFFMISGLLAGLKELRQKSKPTKFIVSRYLRLEPMYLLTYAYIRKFGHLLSDGPLWDYGVSPQSETLQCNRESWLVPILMLANYIPPFSHCVLTGWHIANDFQIFLLLPLVFEAYHSSRFRGRAAILVGITGSILHDMWNFLSSSNFEFLTLAMEPFAQGQRILLGRMAFAYENPIKRMGSLLLGVLIADLLLSKGAFGQTNHFNSRHERGASIKNGVALGVVVERDGTESTRRLAQVDQTDKPMDSGDDEPVVGFKDSKKGGAFLGVLTILLAASTAAWPDDIKGNYIFAHKLTYPLVSCAADVGWFILLRAYLFERCRVNQLSSNGSSNDNNRCCDPNRKQNERLKNPQSSLLMAPFWNALAKLNYTVMLTHFTLARYLIQSQRQLLVLNWMDFTQFVLFLTVSSYFCASFIHLTIELPLSSLIKKAL